MAARRTWNALANNACDHYLNGLAPAVALPAPRHDRRRTGAAGSPPGGFPFLELTPRGCEMCGRARGAQTRLSFYRRRTKLRSFPPPLARGVESTTLVSRASEARPGTPRPDLRP